MCHPTINLDETKPGDFEIWFKYHVRTSANLQEQIASAVKDAIAKVWRATPQRVCHALSFFAVLTDKNGCGDLHAGVFVYPDGIHVDICNDLDMCNTLMRFRHDVFGEDGVPIPFMDASRN